MTRLNSLQKPQKPLLFGPVGRKSCLEVFKRNMRRQCTDNSHVDYFRRKQSKLKRVGNFTPRQIANIARIFYKQEELILKAAGTLERRLQHYIRRTDREFIDHLEKAKPTTKDALNRAWFGTFTPMPEHYHGARYRAINLNNVWRTGTVEFRLFNGMPHAGEVKAHIQLCLAIATKALNAKCASTKKQRPYNEASAAHDMRVFLFRLGFIGPKFKNSRMHLTKRMPGNSAWKNGRPEGR